MNLVEALAGGVGPRTAGSDAAVRAADTVAAAFRELGLEPRFQEFDLVGYEADEPELEVEGEHWPAGPCMYAHAFDGEGTVKKIGESKAPVGEGMLPNFAVVGADGREVARLLTSPFSTGAIPFMSAHVHITTPPTAFVSRSDSERLQDGMRVHLKVGGRFLPGRRERNVIAELPGRSDERVLVSAHYDSVWHGPGAIDNASGVEGVRRVGEALAGRDLTRTVQLVAFAAEEIKLTGSRWYVDEAKLRGELDRIAGVVNLDCIARGDKLNVLASPDAMLGRAVEAARGLGLLDRYELDTGPATGGVDSHWFADAGVPAVTILHFPYDEYHLPADGPALVDETLMDDAVRLALELVESQLAHPIGR
ncbi:MAG: M20/M25/M40 family metallo-hydrolase [Thermoleophilia bacterium]|nr:M20/M25/M40 family metallo-hydrolase [Thermoleophilia bacterium]